MVARGPTAAERKLAPNLGSACERRQFAASSSVQQMRAPESLRCFADLPLPTTDSVRHRLDLLHWDFDPCPQPCIHSLGLSSPAPALQDGIHPHVPWTRPQSLPSVVRFSKKGTARVNAVVFAARIFVCSFAASGEFGACLLRALLTCSRWSSVRHCSQRSTEASSPIPSPPLVDIHDRLKYISE